jgi:SAM-dependent methyltransferase
MTPDTLAAQHRVIYDALAGEYAARTLLHRPANQARAQMLASLLYGGWVLDPGCGTGDSLAELAAAGFAVTGCDVSPAMLTIARQACPEAHLVQGDFMQADLGGTFDAIVETALLHLYPKASEDAVFARLRGLLVPGGLLSVSTTIAPASSEGWQDKPDYGDARLHFRRHFTAPELAGVMGAQGFRILGRHLMHDPTGKLWMTVTAIQE